MGLQKMYGDSIAIYRPGVNIRMSREGIVELFKKLSGYLGKLWLGIAFLLVATLSFEAGVLKQALEEPRPLIVAAPSALSPATVPERIGDTKPVALPKPTDANRAPVTEQDGCALVGSKNSNKYHAPTSRCAKQIKPENRVCFASVEAAKSKGYLAGCLE